MMKIYNFPLDSVADKLQKLIAQAIANSCDLQLDPATIHLEHPANAAHGDWSTNTALALAKQLGKSPRELAQSLAEGFADTPIITKTEVAGPGFINFYIDDNYFAENLQAIDEDYIQKTLQRKQLKIVAEMGDPNTHKFPHIGHLFNYVVGDSFARMHQMIGDQVYKVTWQGDIGPQVAKAIYGWWQLGKPEPEDLIEKMRVLQEAYQLGSQLAKDEGEHKVAIDELNKKIYAEDATVMDDWLKTKKWSLDFDQYFENLLGINIEQRYLESMRWREGAEIVRENIGKVFSESDGAIVFIGEKYGLHTRVFLTKQGTPTYEAKEIGLNVQKMRDFPFDLTIIPTGAEQNEYFKVVFQAIELIKPELKDKFLHVGTGMLSLSSGKMSSRTGDIITAYDVIMEVKKLIDERLLERESINDDEKEDLSWKIVNAAIKYSLLKNNVRQDAVFDLQESIAFEGNSGPYLQYTYTRIQSVLNQSTAVVKFFDNVLVAPSEKILQRILARLPETILQAAEQCAPHLLATYLFELAQTFNAYYKEHSINSAETTELIAARRFLASKVAMVLKTGLAALGIEIVAKM